MYLESHKAKENRKDAVAYGETKTDVLSRAVLLFVFGQASLDEARGRIYSIREAYRNELLEAERRREEELAAQEAALKAERRKNKKR